MNNKKVLLLSLGNLPTGPTTWKNGLLKHARANGVPISEIDTTSITSLFKIGHLFKTDIIHTFHISPSTMVFLILGKILGKKIIFTLHGNIFAEDKSKNGLKKMFWLPFYDIVFKISDKITFPSHFLYNKIVHEKPSIKERSVIIYCGIDFLENLVQNNNIVESPKILEITNFNHYDKGRGVVPLIEAVNKLRNNFPAIVLTIVGGGKHREEFRSKYESEFILFEGFQTNVDEYFNNCHIFVHSTFLDNFPYTILEAVSRKIPTISVNTGAISEMLPVQSVTEPTCIDLESAIYHLLKSQQFRDNNINSNHQFIQKFSWSNIITDFIKVYNE